MKWYPTIFTPIAASNIFGVAQFFIFQQSITQEQSQFLRGGVFLIAIIISLLAHRQIKFFAIVSSVILVAGIASSIWALAMGINQSSNIAIGLAVLWLLLFSGSVWVLLKNVILPKQKIA